MNQPSTDSSTSSTHGISADAISRRAYEIWEREGRPEGCDLRHWLQAEQELGVSRADDGQRPGPAPRVETSTSRNASADTRPMPGTRGAAPTAGNRDQKRPVSTTPFTGEKNGTSSVSGGNAAKRKPAAAPVL